LQTMMMMRRNNIWNEKIAEWEAIICTLHLAVYIRAINKEL
jgi:hypothetical protein